MQRQSYEKPNNEHKATIELLEKRHSTAMEESRKVLKKKLEELTLLHKQKLNDFYMQRQSYERLNNELKDEKVKNGEAHVIIAKLQSGR